jgi:hypothetical protein
MNLKNDNEFENLFRRAADNFPLNTSVSDWESVLAKLEEKDEKKAFILINKKLLIVLLCLLFVVGGTVLSLLIASKNNEKNGITVEVNRYNESKVNKSLENTIGAAVYKKIVDSLKKQQLIGSVNNTLSHKISANIYSNSKQAVSCSKASNNQFAYNSNVVFVKRKPIKYFEKKMVDDVYDVKNTSDNGVLKVDTTSKIMIAIIASNSVITKIDRNTASTKNTDTAVLLNNVTHNAKKKENKNKFFYTGLLYATDKSSLKFQQNKGLGYSLALVLGYQLSNVFSIETGLHIEKKEYYTSGENFNKSIIPATGRINWIEAENKLLEIPITLKHNFFIKKSHQFFATAGLSSYLINNEYYEFEEEIGGILQNGFVLYEKNTSNLFATYNFSIGYQLNVKKIGSFRIEPYINLPFKGFGLGQASIISRGVYLGWIYNLKNKIIR